MAKKKQVLSGIDTVLKNLNAEIEKIEGRTTKGVIKAGIMISKSMDKESPKIPIDTGNLRSSRFVVTAAGVPPEASTLKSGTFRGDTAKELATNHTNVIKEQKNKLIALNKPVLILGFTANYATFVHENLEARFYRPDAPKGKKGRQGSGAKFLEYALQRNQQKILDIIAKEAKIK